jgi:hypothetical protein
MHDVALNPLSLRGACARVHRFSAAADGIGTVKKRFEYTTNIKPSVFTNRTKRWMMPYRLSLPKWIIFFPQEIASQGFASGP